MTRAFELHAELRQATTPSPKEPLPISPEAHLAQRIYERASPLYKGNMRQLSDIANGLAKMLYPEMVAATTPSPSAADEAEQWLRHEFANAPDEDPDLLTTLTELLTTFASARVAEAVERERAENIRIAESTRSGKYMQSWNNACGAVAIAIRARKP